jgi:quercetin dioxygenase-like cupin family protein
MHLSPPKEKGEAMVSKFCKVALCFFSAGVLVTAHADETLKVDTRGVTAKILYEAPIDGGHLPELKGKYKMRITEITIAPGGQVGDHNHLGPGIRQMTVGEMEYILPDKTMIYRAGDFFFETGDVSHRVNNKTSAPNTHLLFEILPLDLKGASLIVPKDKPRQ